MGKGRSLTRDGGLPFCPGDEIPFGGIAVALALRTPFSLCVPYFIPFGISVLLIRGAEVDRRWQLEIGREFGSDVDFLTGRCARHLGLGKPALGEILWIYSFGARRLELELRGTAPLIGFLLLSSAKTILRAHPFLPPLALGVLGGGPFDAGLAPFGAFHLVLSPPFGIFFISNSRLRLFPSEGCASRALCASCAEPWGLYAVAWPSPFTAFIWILFQLLLWYLFVPLGFGLQISSP